MTGTDSAAAALGIDVVALDEDQARVEMTVTAEMVNGHGVCHGGIIFTLADTAMDHLSNAHAGPGRVAFAAHAEVDYVRPGRVGDRLVAQAVIGGRWGRTQMIDATVVNDADETVAIFRGRTRTVERR